MKITDSKHRLMELMEAFDVTQSDISKKTGIQNSAISMYINGTRIPRQDKIGAIADAYNVDPAWLMGYDLPMRRRDAAETAQEHFELLEKFSKLSDRDKALIISMIDSMLG